MHLTSQMHVGNSKAREGCHHPTPDVNAVIYNNLYRTMTSSYGRQKRSRPHQILLPLQAQDVHPGLLVLTVTSMYTYVTHTSLSSLADSSHSITFSSHNYGMILDFHTDFM